ncbi:hypothetical protein BDP27DRAFT_1317937 [Rhodocollybia butyracea]|uniref:Uncharacterized protein n=1 Tax=Rhodocollybia butyracea TaxID=206335 RepID=A0A9P5Q5Q2_9AGAR|nr:hypothetical protein BDP27DRAFT_1317937 [Rhodocollybia butyracea]
MEQPSIELSHETESRLQLLVQAAEALGLEDPSLIGSSPFSCYDLLILTVLVRFYQRLTNLSSRRLNLKLSLNRAIYIEEELRIHLAGVEAELSLIKKSSESLIDGSIDQNTETAESLERQRQAIVRKAKEYQAQLAQLNSMSPPESLSTVISDLEQLQDRNKEREQAIRRKRKRIEAFRGLPANPELARLSLLQATHNLRELTRAREGLLSRMIENERSR